MGGKESVARVVDAKATSPDTAHDSTIDEKCAGATAHRKFQILSVGKFPWKAIFRKFRYIRYSGTCGQGQRQKRSGTRWVGRFICPIGRVPAADRKFTRPMHMFSGGRRTLLIYVPALFFFEQEFSEALGFDRLSRVGHEPLIIGQIVNGQQNWTKHLT